jgi:2-haloacid dehalogenase
MAEPSSRWATFDVYGTLVDWNSGIGAELARLFGGSKADELLASYHAIEPRIQREQPTSSYRDVMALALTEIATQVGAELPAKERDALAGSLPRWPVFPEVPDALADARRRGWKLVALSNSDRDLIEVSLSTIGVPFDGAVVASEIGSYKPAHGHWRAFEESTGADSAHHVHVAQSHFHDIVPATELGLRTIWINRLGEHGEPAPTRELADLTGLGAVLDELVPPG